jgi:sacsin
MSTGQPAYIHARFSLSSDRARLISSNDSSLQDRLPGKWNDWLFRELIPPAWANLLSYLAEKYPEQSAFGRWPKQQQDKNNALYKMSDKVLEIVEEHKCKLWYTDVGYVTLNSALLASGRESAALRKALSESRVPVIYIEDELRSVVTEKCKTVHYLNCQTLCLHLEREQEKLRATNDQTKQVILEYVLSDPDFRGYGSIELFPFEDGTYKAIEQTVAFIHRDDDEYCLFRKEKEHNFDLQRVSDKTRKVLQEGCSSASLHPSLRHRSTPDLGKYCLENYFRQYNPDRNIIPASEYIWDFVADVWKWIVDRSCSILDINISCLWLVPLTNGQLRKIKPVNTSSDITIHAPSGDLGDFLKILADITADCNKPILAAGRLSPLSLRLLMDTSKEHSGLFIKNGNILEDLMLWIREIRGVFGYATDEVRSSILKLLAPRSSLCRDKRLISDTLGMLEIFQKVRWEAEGDDM